MRLPQVLIVDPVAPVGAQPHGVDRVAAVVAHLDAEAPVGMIGPLIDEPVGCLIGAKLVVIDFLVVVGGEQGIGTGGGVGVAAVKKRRRGGPPRPRGKFGPAAGGGGGPPPSPRRAQEFPASPSRSPTCRRRA